ncbi:hypothetical protein PV04_08592 [Phialophora macrospora]|uniref:Uncharacterized protein n=1 Tax=Phialophora macrospora TaxID=1851006 RepID=A0A0D2CES6_9EURO|nr:hypothetical protein PV04_08592 [Phialophora macrospora]
MPCLFAAQPSRNRLGPPCRSFYIDRRSTKMTPMFVWTISPEGAVDISPCLSSTNGSGPCPRPPHLAPQPWKSNVPFLDLVPGVDLASMAILDVRTLPELCTAQTPASGPDLTTEVTTSALPTLDVRHTTLFLPWVTNTKSTKLDSSKEIRIGPHRRGGAGAS